MWVKKSVHWLGQKFDNTLYHLTLKPTAQNPTDHLFCQYNYISGLQILDSENNFR